MLLMDKDYPNGFRDANLRWVLDNNTYQKYWKGYSNEK